MAIFGSFSLASIPIEQKLTDEVRILINSIVFKTLFQGIQNRMNLIQTKIFRSGNVLLYYQPL